MESLFFRSAMKNSSVFCIILMVKKGVYNMKNLKMIVTDIDSTLCNTAKEVMPVTRKVLNDLHARGVLFGIASGRPIGDHMRARPKQWNLDFYPDFIIGMNGGQLSDTATGTYQEFYQLPAEVLREIVDMMEPMPAVPCLYVGEDYFALEASPRLVASSKKNKNQLIVAKDKDDLCKEASANIMFRLHQPEDMEKIEAWVNEHPSDKYIGYKTQSVIVEFNDPRVNKGVAVKKYCEDFGIDLDEVISFGDTSNDNEMLKTTGHSVCMLNGTDDTKACAKVISDYTCDEDGMGRYLLDHIR